tara:strand:+ start:12494 stop:13972 length:1479 start_codon:yes stop_codon:yes gene_type:complete
MKKIFNYGAIASLILIIASCSKDYLEVSPTQFLTQEQVAEASVNNPDVIAGSLAGIYSLTFNTGTGGTTGHDDFGQKGYDIYSDFLCSDMALSLSTYGWYRTLTELTVTTDFTQQDNYQPWRYYYRIIRSANTVIAALGGNDAVPELEANKYIMGQTKAMRAHSYFYLAQLYADKYDPAHPILPIYNDPSQGSQPKSTTADVYAFITKDLTDAISLLDGFDRAAKNEINVYVAKGILAYVYAAMGDKNTEVVTLTNDIITNGGFPLLSAAELTGGFNDVNTPSWMWGFDITLDNGLDLVSWWGQMDIFTYSYAWAGDRKTIDQGLFDAIPADDVRKGQFLDNPASGYNLSPYNKFYDSGRTIGGQRNITTDYIFMRIEEMYLLNAEASARGTNEIGARNMLKTLLQERLPDVTYVDGLSGQALLDEIYLQTRIEFWGEGKSYLAMKRNKATIVRGTNHLSLVGQPISYDDNRLTFEIPDSEIQNNPLINDQN